MHVAAHLERVYGPSSIERVEAGDAVGRRAGRLEGAVTVDADQLNAAAHKPKRGLQKAKRGIPLGNGRVSERGHGNVRAAAHLERVDCVGGAERIEAGGAVDRRAGRLEGTVFVDADQQDAVSWVGDPARGHRGVCAAAHLEHVGCAGGAQQAKSVGTVGDRAGRLEGAVLVDAGKQHALVVGRYAWRPDHGNMQAAAHLERVGGDGAVERREAAGAAVGRAGRLEGAVLVDADQLDGAVAVPRGHGGVRGAAHLERVDGLCAA